MGKVYLYHTVESKLAAAFERIESSGDAVLFTVYKGGHARDYTLICREDPAVADTRGGRSDG